MTTTVYTEQDRELGRLIGVGTGPLYQQRIATEMHLCDLHVVLPSHEVDRLQHAYEQAFTLSSMGRICRIIDRIHTEVFAPDLYAAQREG